MTVTQIVTDPVGIPLLNRLMGLVGIAAMLGVAWLLSEDRLRVPWKLVAVGLGLQGVFGFLVLKTPFGRSFFDVINAGFVRLLSFTEDGARFLFGNLVKNNVPAGTPIGEPLDMAPLGETQLWVNTGGYFAFSVLPVIIFFSALVAVLYHMGIMQRVVQGIAWVMQRTMRTSGAETLAVAGNIFVGPTESPLLIKPFVRSLTMSELNTVMVSGFATIAGSVLAAYIGMLSPFMPDIGGHLMTASVMNAPAALLISKILFPERERAKTGSGLAIETDTRAVNVIEAAASGASQGLKLALEIGAMLMVFIALVAMLNFFVGVLGGLFGFPQLSIEQMFGWVLAPVAWLLGVPWADANTVGSLMGVKVVLNEFIAYLQLSDLLSAGDALSPRASIIAAYALLGFANFSTIAIQIGGIGGIAPERRGDLARLGVRAMIGGNLAAFMSAAIAGMLI